MLDGLKFSGFLRKLLEMRAGDGVRAMLNQAGEAQLRLAQAVGGRMRELREALDRLFDSLCSYAFDEQPEAESEFVDSHRRHVGQ